MPQTIHVRAGDTEPLEFTIDAAGLDDLDELDTAVFYVRRKGSATNHVDGAPVTVSDSATKTLSFDPVDAKEPTGNAFDEPGTYLCYTRVEWSDGDFTRHPGNPDDDMIVRVHSNLE